MADAMKVSREEAVRMADEVLGILRAGRYVAPGGREVPIRDLLADARAGTVSYPPGHDVPMPAPRDPRTRIRVEKLVPRKSLSRGPDGDEQEVRVEKQSLVARTDAEGRYTFPVMASGKYTFVVTVPGHKPRRYDIAIPAKDEDRLEDYDLEFCDAGRET